MPALLTPPVEDATRRQLLRCAGAALLLGAAGCDEPRGEAAAPTASPGVRRIEHALVAADVPARLERVVVIDSFTTLHTALLLYVPVVGATTFDGAEPFASFLPSEETEGIASVGYLELDLEAIAALEPDLIVGSEQFMAEPYDRLAQIAPAVAIDYIPQVDWKDHERLLGEVLGQRAAVDERVAAGGGGFDPDAAAQALARYEGNPLWQGLEAVQHGRVHAVDPTYWLSGGVRAAELILDDLGRWLG